MSGWGIAGSRILSRARARNIDSIPSNDSSRTSEALLQWVSTRHPCPRLETTRHASHEVWHEVWWRGRRGGSRVAVGKRLSRQTRRRCVGGSRSWHEYWQCNPVGCWWRCRLVPAVSFLVAVGSRVARVPVGGQSGRGFWQSRVVWSGVRRQFHIHSMPVDLSRADASDGSVPEAVGSKGRAPAQF